MWTDQTAWVNLLQGDPLVIMLDELPPYFVNAASKSIGNSDLSVVTATALANLLVAVGRGELRNVCLVVCDLTTATAVTKAGGDTACGCGRTTISSRARTTCFRSGSTASAGARRASRR